MPKYHINTSGSVHICRASKNPCPYGDDMHFTDIEDAHEAAEGYLEERMDLEEFPRLHDAADLRIQSRIYFEEDQRLGYGNHAYDGYIHDGHERRFEDYHAGLLAGLNNNAEDEPRLEKAYAEDTDRPRPGLKDMFDHTAYRLGYARALRTRAEGKRFLDHDIADYKIDHYKGANGKYDNLRFVHNPFKQGQKILIPEGTRYTTVEKGQSVEKFTSKPQWVKVENSSRNYVTGSVGKVFLNTAKVTYAATPNGAWRDVVVTPELLSVNGQKTYEDPCINADMYLTPIYDDVRQWSRHGRS